MDDGGNSCTQSARGSYLGSIGDLKKQQARIYLRTYYIYSSTDHVDMFLKRASAKREPFIMLAVQAGPRGKKTIRK